MHIACVLSTALLVPFLTLAVDTAATSTKETAVKDVDAKLEEFLKLKDDTTLTDAEKTAKENELRKEILQDILALSYAEIDDLQSQLSSLSNLNDSEKQWQQTFLTNLGDYRHYYDDTQEKIKGDVSLDNIQAFKTWRDHTYAPRAKTAVDFALVIQERTILAVAQERYKKILADITKLARSGHLSDAQFSDLSDMLIHAKEQLDTAHKLNAHANDLLTNELNAANATTTPTASSTPSSLNSLENAPASATSTNATTTPDTVSGSVQTSLLDVKNAYKIFLDMSQSVKKILGLQ